MCGESKRYCKAWVLHQAFHRSCDIKRVLCLAVETVLPVFQKSFDARHSCRDNRQAMHHGFVKHSRKSFGKEGREHKHVGLQVSLLQPLRVRDMAMEDHMLVDP